MSTDRKRKRERSTATFPNAFASSSHSSLQNGRMTPLRRDLVTAPVASLMAVTSSSALRPENTSGPATKNIPQTKPASTAIQYSPFGGTSSPMVGTTSGSGRSFQSLSRHHETLLLSTEPAPEESIGNQRSLLQPASKRDVRMTPVTRFPGPHTLPSVEDVKDEDIRVKPSRKSGRNHAHRLAKLVAKQESAAILLRSTLAGAKQVTSSRSGAASRPLPRQLARFTVNLQTVLCMYGHAPVFECCKIADNGSVPFDAATDRTAIAFKPFATSWIHGSDGAGPQGIDPRRVAVAFPPRHMAVVTAHIWDPTYEVADCVAGTRLRVAERYQLCWAETRR